jgi:sodium/potassium-transporting ATPase subunit alpha
MNNANIKVVIVTGDNHITAQAIARQVNLLTFKSVQHILDKRDLPIPRPLSDSCAIVITGNVMDDLNERDWLHIMLFHEVIFARVLPQHKLMIVKHAQSVGHIVAVTGDGANDQAAIKQADLGISMNKSASDITKESARMILLDDNFNTTLTGIKEGRLIFINMKKAIKYSLSHILAEIMPYLLYVVVPLPLPITPTQILTIDLGFELLVTLSFAWEPAEDENLMMSMVIIFQITLAAKKNSFTRIHSTNTRFAQLKS